MKETKLKKLEVLIEKKICLWLIDRFKIYIYSTVYNVKIVL